MSTMVKERLSKQLYRQAVMHCYKKDGSYAEYVAWLPAEKAMPGKVLRIDSMPGLWKVVSAGSPRPEYIVEAYAEHGRKGLPDGAGPSTPMKQSPSPKKSKRK